MTVRPYRARPASTHYQTLSRLIAEIPLTSIDASKKKQILSALVTAQALLVDTLTDYGESGDDIDSPQAD